jgi:hypothetical protein
VIPALPKHHQAVHVERTIKSPLQQDCADYLISDDIHMHPPIVRLGSAQQDTEIGYTVSRARSDAFPTSDCFNGCPNSLRVMNNIHMLYKSVIVPHGIFLLFALNFFVALPKAAKP